MLPKAVIIPCGQGTGPARGQGWIGDGCDRPRDLGLKLADVKPEPAPANDPEFAPEPANDKAPPAAPVGQVVDRVRWVECVTNGYPP